MIPYVIKIDSKETLLPNDLITSRIADISKFAEVSSVEEISHFESITSLLFTKSKTYLKDTETYFVAEIRAEINEEYSFNILKYLSNSLKSGAEIRELESCVVSILQPKEEDIINELISIFSKLIIEKKFSKFQSMVWNISQLVESISKEHYRSPFYYFILGICNYFLDNFDIAYSNFIKAKALNKLPFVTNVNKKYNKIIEQFLLDSEKYMAVKFLANNELKLEEIEERKVSLVACNADFRTPNYFWQDDIYNIVSKSDLPLAFVQEVQKTNILYILSQIFDSYNSLVESIPLDSDFIIFHMHYNQEEGATIAVKDDFKNKVNIKTFFKELSKLKFNKKPVLIILGCNANDFFKYNNFDYIIGSIGAWNHTNIIPFTHAFFKSTLLSGGKKRNILKNDFEKSKLFTSLFSWSSENLKFMEKNQTSFTKHNKHHI